MTPRFKYTCPECNGRCRVITTHLIKNTRRSYIYCTMCDHRFRLDRSIQEVETAIAQQRLAKYAPELQNILLTPDAELDEMYGDPDRPTLAFRAWCREILAARVS